MSLHFHTAYITHAIPTCDFFTIVPDKYFSVLLAYESMLVMQFYKSNTKCSIVARNYIILYILHHVLYNACWQPVCLSLMKCLFFWSKKELTCHKAMNLTSAFPLHHSNMFTNLASLSYMRFFIGHT